MKVSLKIPVVMAISFATWLTTSAIVAQYPKRVAPGVRRENMETKVAVATKLVEAAPASVKHPNMIASISLRSFKVSVTGNKARVKAAASMADKRAGMSYVWWLSIVDPADNLVAGRVYGDQIFLMEADLQMEPTFEDVVEIPSGSRRISLSLHALGPGQDLSLLQDEEFANNSRLIRGVHLLSE